MPEVQRQDAQVFDWNETGGAVELERGGVARLRLDRQADSPGFSSCLANSTQQRPPSPPVPGAGHDVQIPQLPKAAKAL